MSKFQIRHHKRHRGREPSPASEDRRQGPFQHLQRRILRAEDAGQPHQGRDGRRPSATRDAGR